MDASKKEIADRAAHLHVGQRGSPCVKCKSRLAYVNAMSGISCRTCEPPYKSWYVRLPIVLVEIDGANIWQDGRIESRLEKWSKQCGVPVSELRKVERLPRQFTQAGVMLWPPFDRNFSSLPIDSVG